MQSNGCLYCQAHSVSQLAKNNNVSEEKLAALWEFESSPLFNDAERAGLRLHSQSRHAPTTRTMSILPN
ncbi:MAG: hypothetical protein GKR94_15100 [Gammaproteobacteria bacterium]|nr:hypothetical protein [Gammaproteobacteria bacterium]